MFAKLTLNSPPLPPVLGAEVFLAFQWLAVSRLRYWEGKLWFPQLWPHCRFPHIRLGCLQHVAHFSCRHFAGSLGTPVSLWALLGPMQDAHPSSVQHFFRSQVLSAFSLLQANPQFFPFVLHWTWFPNPSSSECPSPGSDPAARGPFKWFSDRLGWQLDFYFPSDCSRRRQATSLCLRNPTG